MNGANIVLIYLTQAISGLFSLLGWLKYFNVGWVTWCRQYSCSNRKIGHEAGGRNGEG